MVGDKISAPIPFITNIKLIGRIEHLNGLGIESWFIIIDRLYKVFIIKYIDLLLLFEKHLNTRNFFSWDNRLARRLWKSRPF